MPLRHLCYPNPYAPTLQVLLGDRSVAEVVANFIKPESMVGSVSERLAGWVVTWLCGWLGG